MVHRSIDGVVRLSQPHKLRPSPVKVPFTNIKPAPNPTQNHDRPGGARISTHHISLPDLI